MFIPRICWFTVCEKFPSLLYYLSLSICRSILRSCTANSFFANSDVAVVDVIVTRKRELSQVNIQIFLCGVTQRPMIIIANLKKSIRVKASRPLSVCLIV